MFCLEGTSIEAHVPVFIPHYFILFYRCYVSVAVIGETIYACGGFDGVQRHNSAEKYDLARNQWTLVKPMFHKRSDAGAACLRGSTFIHYTLI